MYARLLFCVGLVGVGLSAAWAGALYRWTDPGSGKLLVSPEAPPYRVLSERVVGALPGGDMVELTLDPNDPQVKALTAKRLAQEAEKKRVAQEEQRKKAAQEEAARKQAEAEAAKEAAKKAEMDKEREDRLRQQLAKDQQERAVAAELQKKEATQRASVRQAVIGRITTIKARSSQDKDIDFIVRIVDKFLQYEKFASTTARINLAIPINNLLNTKMEVSGKDLSPCYAETKKRLLVWMDQVIKIYYDFSAQHEAEIGQRDEMDAAFDEIWLKFPDSC
jgi:hypothetical protein